MLTVDFDLIYAKYDAMQNIHLILGDGLPSWMEECHMNFTQCTKGLPIIEKSMRYYLTFWLK